MSTISQNNFLIKLKTWLVGMISFFKPKTEICDNYSCNLEKLDEETVSYVSSINLLSQRIIQKLSEEVNTKRIVQIIEDSSTDALLSIDQYGYILTVNPATLNMFGYDENDLARINIKDIIPLFSTKEPSSEWSEFRGLNKDASEFSIELITKKISEMNESCGCKFLIIAKDISYKKELEANNFHLSNIVDTLIHNSPNPIYHKDITLRYVGCNKPFEELAGVNFKELLGKNVFDIFPKDVAEYANRKDLELIASVNINGQNRQIYSCKVRNNKSPKESEVVVYSTPVLDSENKVNGIVGTIIDLTDYLKAKRSAGHLESVLNETAFPVFITDVDGLVLFANNSLCKLVNFDSEEIVSNSSSIFVKSIVDNFITLHNKDGSEITLQLKTVKIPSESEESIMFILTFK